MIDWLTLKRDVLPHEFDAISEYLSTKPQIMKWTPRTGEIEWSQPVRESIRSDTHQVLIYVTHNTITISGSPSNSLGYDCNVFGTDDILIAGNAHLEVAKKSLPFDVGVLKEFRVSRIDITHNYDMGGRAEVRQALAYLRSFDGGRYRVNTASETVYWSQGSSLRSGKAYHKGEHLRYTNKKGTTDIDSERIELADRILRLELKLGNKWFSRKRDMKKKHFPLTTENDDKFFDVWKHDYQKEFENYFKNFIGNVEVKEMNLQDKVIEVAPTPGQGLSAFRTWTLIQSIGYQSARASMPKSTWYRHTKMLKDAGLGWGDFSEGKILPFRSRTLTLDSPVSSWDELRKVV